MIAWKASVKFLPSWESEPKYTNISEIEFDDPTSAFPFLTTLNKSVLAPVYNNFKSQPSVYKLQYGTNLQIVYDYMDELLGTDSLKYYGACTSESRWVDWPTWNDYFDGIAKIFPGYYGLYPKSIEKFQQRIISEDKPGQRMSLLWYVPSLKRVIVLGRNSANIYKVDEHGNLTSMVDPYKISNSFPYWNNGQTIGYYGVRGVDYDGTLDSLLNPLNHYVVINETYSNTFVNFGINRINPNSASTISNFGSILEAIFSDYSPPNYDPDSPNNPYEPGGPSGPTDPNLPPGTFDDESDPIPDSPLPTLSAANTGFTRIYNPTLSQVQALARYLWTDESVIETIWNHIKQFFENPMEAIIGFNLVPVPVPDGGTENFALMYIDTGVSMTIAANQFVDLDCGTVELKRYYGSALDQSPYTKVSCFLPYIGTVNLNTDEVMGTTLQVKYRVDIVSGSCVAKIFVDGNCLYQYSGHCAITIPISSADFSSYVSAAISVGKLAAAAITAGAGAAMAAGVAEVSQQTNQVVTTTQVTNTARNPSTGRQITTGTTTTVQTRESPADQSSTQASFGGLSPQNVANTVGAIMSSKPHIEHSGSFSGNSGYLGIRRPFLIIERPNMCMPENYQTLNGFPAMFTMELSTCKGFTRVQQVQLTGMGRATNPEQAEILELLKSGVIL